MAREGMTERRRAPDAQQAAQELLARRAAKVSLSRYIEYAELGFLPVAHHKLLIRELERVAARSFFRAVSSYPLSV